MRKGQKHSFETREKIRRARTGVSQGPFSEEARKNMSAANRGKIPKNLVWLHSPEGRKLAGPAISKALKGRKKPWLGGEKSHLWRGGITKANKTARQTLEYKQWRREVFERDDYKCVFCGAKGVALHADHIKAFAFYKEMRTVVENGRTLCVPCHKKTDNYRKRTK